MKSKPKTRELKDIEDRLVKAIEECPTNVCLMDDEKVIDLMEKRDELLGLTDDDDDDDDSDEDDEDDDEPEED